MAKIYFKNKDGLKLAGILEKPKSKTNTCIILCHGATVDKEEDGIFTDLSRKLSNAGFATFRFDFMGHGESEGDTINTTIKGEAQDIDSASKLLISKGYKKFGIVAASFSGGPASYFVLSHQDKVKALIYWNSVLEYKSLLKRWIAEGNEQRLKEKGYIIRRRTRYGKKLIEEVSELRPWKELYKIKIPVLFIHGDKDSSVPYEQSVKYSKMIKAKLETIHGAEHGFHDSKKHSDQADRTTIEFFSKVLNDNMKIYLIRHGETTGDVEDRYGGDYDDNLSPKGVRQSKELAKKLKGKGIEIIYVSPRIRAIETASIVNKSLNVKLKIVDDLRERNNYGILTGLLKSEAKQRHPEEVKELGKGIHHKVNNSEDYVHFKKRIMKAFKKIANDKEHRTTAIITHGGPIRCIIREILKAGELARDLNDCAILTIKKDKSNLSIVNLDGAVLAYKQIGKPKVMPKIIKDVGFDFDWSSRKVWALDISVTTIPISDLAWHFDVHFWNKPDGGYYDLTPNEVLADPQRYKSEYDRVLNCDMKHPIDIMENKGRLLILDGLHRLVRAKLLGMDVVKVRKIPRTAIPQILK
ncbi:MAG: alpha/beta fold hydrolase [Candidatus Micrarchaeaceae archaeon]|jgi:broad specificity phosphatase PhoE/alpha/beta superfamily hydrolase|nr:prolyl oligopeptidase family serine peptidase [Candidatus Micrarchaeota archaeon]HII10195.1 prolyl oligopeptidase family serine peptidase [Candidatus Micrarchaeota archaeon]